MTSAKDLADFSIVINVPEGNYTSNIGKRGVGVRDAAVGERQQSDRGSDNALDSGVHVATDSGARSYERADGKAARPRAREWRLREAYAAEQARRKAEAEAAEKRRQEENERLR